ncbi:MAG: molybdopterin-dependent oxidoreductase [Thermovirgaceae bacterium]|nr:molybdopterin-dependent oxidoreductase [Thermovirgaceae bacterium]
MENSIPTACPYDCPDACPFLARKESGGSLSIGPNPEFPLGGGFICPKGARWDLVRKHPSRLKTPLRRNGSSWDMISWDEAWSLWANKTEDSISRWGPLSVFFSRGYGSLYFSKNLLGNVFATLGGYTTTIGSLCGAAGVAGLKKTFGFTPVMLPDNISSHSMGVLLWGRNAAETNTHLLPLIGHLRNRGGSVAAIEIRETATTRIADSWWRVRPGSDGSLAILLCARLLETGAVCGSWRNNVSNPAAFEAMLSGLDRSAALESTGLKENEIDEIALWLIENRPVALYPGYGIQRYLAGSDTFHALAALSVLLGGLEERGGGVIFGKDEMTLFPRSLLRTSPVIRNMPVSSWYSRGNISPPLGVAVFCGGNPAKQSPCAGAFAETMSRIPFKVCVDLFMTETAHMSDLVLPASMFLEEGPDWRGSWWHQYLSRAVKAVDPPEGVLSDLEIFSGLARKMGINADLERERIEMDRILLDDQRIKRISEGIYSWNEPETWGNGHAVARMPEKTPEQSPFSRGLRMVTVHVAGYINGQTAGSSSENAGVPEVVLSPENLSALGLVDRSRVIIRGGSGSMKAVVRSDPGVGDDFCVVRQGIAGVNSLTLPMASPGYGAPFHENNVFISAAGGKRENA